jgi:lipoprotein-releasing system permease protein
MEALFMDFRVVLATKLLLKRKGNFIASVSALVIGVMVILFNSLIFNGVADGILRDLSDYQFGDVLVSKNEGNFEGEDLQLISYLQTISYVEAAAPRLGSVAWMNSTEGFTRNQVDKVQIIGVDPLRDPQASLLYETVSDGSFVRSRGQIVLGSDVAADLKAKVGTRIDLKMTTAVGEDALKEFIVVGISTSPGGLAFDNSAIMTMEDIREMTGRERETSQVIVKLTDRGFQNDLKSRLANAYSAENLKIQTLEEAGEETLAGIRSGIAFINLVGYFGLLSASFAIVTIMMLMVSSKTRDIGIIKSLGGKSSDVLVVFILQGIIIGSIAALSGFIIGSIVGLYLQSIEFSFGPGLVLEVTYDPVFTMTSALFSVVLGTAAAIYPAMRASKLQPIDAMQHV